MESTVTVYCDWFDWYSVVAPIFLSLNNFLNCIEL